MRPISAAAAAAAALAHAAPLPRQSAEITDKEVLSQPEGENVAEIYIIELNGSRGDSQLAASRFAHEERTFFIRRFTCILGRVENVCRAFLTSRMLQSQQSGEKTQR